MEAGCGEGDFEDRAAVVDGFGIQKQGGDGERVGVHRLVGEFLGLTGEERFGERGQYPGPIAGHAVGIQRAAMLQVDERLEAELQKFVAGFAVTVCDETDAACAAINGCIFGNERAREWRLEIRDWEAVVVHSRPSRAAFANSVLSIIGL